MIGPEDDGVPYLGETIAYHCIAQGVTISSPPEWVTPAGEVLQPRTLGKINMIETNLCCKIIYAG